jgi:hypothetical protein
MITIGRIVQYALSSGDADDINRRRRDAEAFRLSHTGEAEPGEPGRSGHIEHYGNEVAAGDICPAVVVRVFSNSDDLVPVNLKVLLDGNDDYWATSRLEGHGFGHWLWPVLV